ncbi:MAG: extracellular solute-binding protein family 3 [Acidimicrobiaceae bacterium]|nr:extracellular solute-binding protein family 3 [Acidimicrobiaceae bacterium]
MQRSTRVRQFWVVVGVGSLIFATAGLAGATSLKGKYSASDAALVPSAYKNTTLQVATDATYPPDESMSGTKMIGFDVDMMGAIATTLGVKYKENNITFDDIIGGIKGGKYAIGNSSFTDEKSREKSVNFVDYFQAGEGVYALSTSSVHFSGLSSFCGLKVAVETGTTEQSDAQSEVAKCPASKKLTVRSYPTQTEANAAVLSGQANEGFVDSQVAGYIVSLAGGKFKLVGSAIQVAPYGIATPKTPNGKKLALAIEAALKTLVSNGTYSAILAKWGVTAGAIPLSKMILNGATS